MDKERVRGEDGYTGFNRENEGQAEEMDEKARKALEKCRLDGELVNINRR
jgi:hypothetical protein